MASADRIAAAIEDALGAKIVGRSSMGGGSIADSARVELSDGRKLFVKTHPRGAEMFPAEAEGLQWLGQAEAIRVPEVVALGPARAPFLALNLIESRGPAPDHDEQLGRSLAALHRFGADRFGHHRDNFIGPLPQTGESRPDWPSFYGQCRLQPMMEQADRADALPSNLRRDLQRVIERLDDLCGPAEPPARLHGDLWGGNAITDERGGPVVLDPAVYGGHREIDLAMMRLFGGFGPRVFAAYDEAFPLCPGHEDRIALYQLYPLLVHVVLFGGAYVGQLQRAVSRYV